MPAWAISSCFRICRSSPSLRMRLVSRRAQAGIMLSRGLALLGVWWAFSAFRTMAAMASGVGGWRAFFSFLVENAGYSTVVYLSLAPLLVPIAAVLVWCLRPSGWLLSYAVGGALIAFQLWSAYESFTLRLPNVDGRGNARVQLFMSLAQLAVLGGLALGWWLMGSDSERPKPA